MSAKYHYLCVFSAVVLFSSALYGDTNVLTNPGFETGDTSGWSPRGCPIEVVTSPVRSGSYSARAYNRTSSWHGIQQNLMGVIVEGQSYLISGYVMIENVPDANVHCVVQQTVDGSTTYNWVDNVVCNNSGWTQLSGAFTPNSGGGMLTELLVYFESDTGVNFYVDDAVVYGPEPGPVEPNATGYVDINTRYQQIEGFGAAGAWYEGWLTDHPLSETLYDILFDQLGLDIYRLRNTYDQDGGDDYMNRSAQIVTAAKERNPNLKILISSWSPPAYLKSNGSTAGGGNATLDGGPSAYVYSDFAEWWADSITAWSSYGVDADYISIQNEPDYDASWDSCRFDPIENSSVAGYNQAFEAVYNEMYLQFGSSMPKMIGPESAGLGLSGTGGYISALINQSHAYGYAHHLYGPSSGDTPDGYLTAMTNFAATYGSKPLFQTEYEQSHAEWPDAFNIALLLHNSLTVEEVSGYLYWSLFWAEPAGLVSFPSYGSSDYTINSDFYGFKQYSAFIHSGWQRVDISDDSDALRTSAYVSPDNNQLTIVAINTSTDTDIELDLSFAGFTVASGEVYRTSQTQNCVNIGSYANPEVMPARSVTTLALRVGATTPPVAVAGPNQVAYAGIDGWADVNLDGCGSYDADGSPLSYYWRWNIDGNDYEANGASPTIQLPVGEHTIELIVDDGTEESEPDYCTIIVIAPLQAGLSCTPATLTQQSCRGWLVAMITMPSGIRQADVSCTEPLVMYPGGIESLCQYATESRWCRKRRTYVWAIFDKSACAEHLEPGKNEVNIVGSLTCGRYYEASCCLWLVPAKRYYWWPFHFWRGRW